MKSPFKFLDAFTAEDRDAFLGREEEIALLYDMVLKNRLLLVYGQSGTGKTSLVQCGLASKFDATDWLPIFVRRQNDINRSLEQKLAQNNDNKPVTSLEDAIGEIYFNSLRPVYLVFDQLEELFILGKASEQDEFVGSIRSLLDSGTPCRVIFIIREEYLAYLYRLEKVIPTLFDRRLRVEPMGINKVQQVLKGSFKQFNIAVESPENQTFGQIIDNLSGGKAGIQLPYLQVYLDLLYREDFARTYKGQQLPENGEWLPVEFSRTEIAALGKIENVLERFLQEQQTRIQEKMQEKHRGLQDDAVKKVLDAFVSEEGTKRPVPYVRLQNGIRLDAQLEPLTQPLTQELLSEICTELEKARILRFEDDQIELAHDALAIQIDNQRTTQQRRLRDALVRLSSGYREFKTSGEYLSRKQLNSMEELLPALKGRIGTDIQTFINDCIQHNEALEHAELVAERQKRKQARKIAIAGFSLALVAVIGLFTAIAQYRTAARNAAEARRNVANTLKVEGKYDEALLQLHEVSQFAHVLSAEEQEKIAETQSKWTMVKALVQQGDSLAKAEDYRAALVAYEKAQQLDGDAHLSNLQHQTEKDLESAYGAAMVKGQILMGTAGGLERAIGNFEQALRLKPDDATAGRLLLECRKKLQ